MSGTRFLELEGTFLFHYLHMPFLLQESKKEQLWMISYDSANADKLYVGLLPRQYPYNNHLMCCGKNEPSQTLQRVKKVYDRTNFTEQK